MAIITNAAFVRHADRIGSQFKLADVVRSQVDAGGLRHVDNILYDADQRDTVLTNPLRSSAIPPSKDGYDVANDLATPARNLDDNLIKQSLYITPFFSNIISAMESHIQKRGAASLDAFLTTSGIQVAQSYADTYNLAKSVKLSAINVFAERDIQLGSLTITASGVGAFASALSMGPGSGKYVTSPDNSISYAPTFVEALVMSGIGGTIMLQLNMQDDALNNVNVNFTIQSGAIPGTVIQSNTAGKRFFKLNASSSYFTGGINNDAVIFRGRILRSIGL